MELGKSTGLCNLKHFLLRQLEYQSLRRLVFLSLTHLDARANILAVVTAYVSILEKRSETLRFGDSFPPSRADVDDAVHPRSPNE